MRGAAQTRQQRSFVVIPAEAGIQRLSPFSRWPAEKLDSGSRSLSLTWPE